VALYTLVHLNHVGLSAVCGSSSGKLFKLGKCEWLFVCFLPMKIRGMRMTSPCGIFPFQEYFLFRNISSFETIWDPLLG